ncbi:MetQ/NlpA family ABC transporter substrate-binding protein [Peribacillus deserti]|uniref:Lipoprotein n=1 Tax=Peribacillus deserti TaxID=673318 RepID=A0A2N5M152_9BACI|nr:MetQ/NlpA family ABC transporter substrate-binding protein [Peribacillus deserti]PLT28082.1 methionine ABC transporter substrate-binding protein [Peribacillus deserti]
MKKYLSLVLVLVISAVLAACGGGNKSGEGKGDTKELTVGASNVPHAKILEQAQPLLKDKGIDLKIVKYQDYIMPNKALNEGQLDANYFQHIPYLNSQMKENGYKFANAGGIHIEPIGVYSKKYKSLNDLPKGAEIIMSSSVADHGRMLSMLEAEGLIKLKAGIDKTAAQVKDITENKKGLKFRTDIEASLLPKVYENKQGDAVLINSNYAIDAGLNPVEDSIALENSDSPYVNVIAVKKGDENKKEIKTLVEVLRSKKIQDFIKKEYKGAVVPVSE